MIVKNEESEARAHKEFGDTVNITTEGKRYLGAVIGSPGLKSSYCNAKATKWIEELTNLNNIAETHPHMAYMRTVSIHCRSTEVQQRNLSFFDRCRTTLNITSSNNIVGRCRKKLSFYFKREWERVVFRQCLQRVLRR